ncbi:MAG: hypothetical protein ACYDB7_14080 [Mycobacteriales bacterium]
MSVTVHLPDDLAARLATEASRRGTDVDQVAAELVAAGLDQPAVDDALEAFIGCGASGQHEPFDIHQARAELASRTSRET